MLVVCLVACFIGTIWAVLCWGNPNVFSKWVRLLSRVILKIAGFEIEIEGEDLLASSQPCIYLCNHQSGIDLFTFGYSAPPNFTVIAKRELRWVPIIGLFFMATGAIFINRKDRKGAIGQLDRAVRAIRERGVSVVIAPEGTRNEWGDGLLPFKKGPFYLAIKAQVPLVPYLCSSLYFLGSFSERRLTPGILRLKVLPPIPTKGLTEADVDALLDKTQKLMLETLKNLKSRTL